MVILFIKESPKYVSKDERLTIQMRSTPNDVESIKYEIKTYAFDDGLPEEWLEHVKSSRSIEPQKNLSSQTISLAARILLHLRLPPVAVAVVPIEKGAQKL